MKRNNYSPSILVVILLISFQGISQDFQGIIDNYLTQNASRHNLEPADVQNFGITSHTKVTNKDYDVAYLQQTYNGIKVAGTAATVVINNNEVVSFKHSFTNDLASKVNASTATLSPADAVRKAAMHLGLQGVDNVKVTDYNTRDDVLLANVNNSNFFSPLYFQKNQNNQYELTYEVIVKDPGLHWWLARVNASNGDLIFKADLNLTCNFDNRVTDAKPHDHRSHSHTFSTNKKSVLLKAKNDATNESRAFSILFDNSSYNAYPLRVESPIHGERTIINEPAIISTQPGDVEIPSPFGWHDLDGLAGAETNFTQGNNVSAYEDTTDNDAPTSPNAFATESSSPLIFDYPVDFSQEPITYQDAVIVNLFVWNNYIHDIFYNYGFDESSGNFQETDYGRFDGDGIIPFNGDSVNAEAQDGSGLNNANMATSLDGANPRMQMFL